ncbi:MAG: metallo-mystery pair system four-Cys motif protein, partial [Myxococcales bacterium]
MRNAVRSAAGIRRPCSRERQRPNRPHEVVRWHRFCTAIARRGATADHRKRTVVVAGCASAGGSGPLNTVEKRSMNKVTVLVGTLALAGIGCDSSSGSTGETVTIEFAAMVGGENFVCGDTYDNLGADDSSLQLSDFRFFVQDVELKNANGDYVAVSLTSSAWQTDNVTLLDFEDGCSGNDFGTPEMNMVVTGTVPAGTYDGLRFEMGVPFDLNHENPATAAPPLNLTTMQWDWQGGY